MSYAVVPAPAKRRPGVVAAASALLYVSAGLLIISAVLGFIPIGEIRQVVTDYYADQPDLRDATSLAFTIGLIVSGVFYLLLAVGLVVLGVLVGKGKQPARIITWVLGGLLVLCTGCGLVSTAASGTFSGMGGAQNEELTRKIEAATPAWLTAVSTTLSVVSLLVVITVIILLALPVANDYFRKEQQIWVPPTAYPATDPTLPPPPPYPPTPPTPPTP
jgi:hypothetical protein